MPYKATTRAMPQGSVVLLDAEEGRHALRVLRLRDGALVEVCDGRGSVAQARRRCPPLRRWLRSTGGAHRRRAAASAGEAAGAAGRPAWQPGGGDPG